MKADRPKQDVAAEAVGDLTRVIRSQFCPDVEEKAWFKDHFHFIRKNVVMWPAAFMCGKGFTLPAARYKEILLAVLGEIKTHGNTAAVKHWQFYLMACVQRHFKAHWEEYYQEAKSARALTEHALMGLGKLKAGGGVDAVEAIAAAQRLASPGRRVRARVKAARQLEFL